jgi:hypothetical protein
LIQINPEQLKKIKLNFNQATYETSEDKITLKKKKKKTCPGQRSGGRLTWF